MLKLIFNGVKLIFNGVQINTFLRHRPLLLYSTATNSVEQPVHFIVDYLVNSLGFSREEAVSASKKVSSLKSSERPKLVVNFLKQIGLSQSQIKTIVSYDPRLLAVRDVDKTLTPRTRVFKDLGLSGSELSTVFVSNPWILLRAVQTNIESLIECLRSILGSDEDVVKAIKRNSFLVNQKTATILSNAALYRSYGLSEETIRKLFLYNPWHFFRQKEFLEKQLKDIETTLGIPRESKMFVYGIHVCSSITSDIMESKFRVFKSYGWTEGDIKTMARKMPTCLNMSEAKIRSGLDFFMKELGYKPDYLCNVPCLLKYSFKNRILPRMVIWKALLEKKLIKENVGIYSIMACSDELFLNNYVMRFKNELPEELCEAYIKKKASSSSKAIAE